MNPNLAENEWNYDTVPEALAGFCLRWELARLVPSVVGAAEKLKRSPVGKPLIPAEKVDAAAGWVPPWKDKKLIKALKALMKANKTSEWPHPWVGEGEYDPVIKAAIEREAPPLVYPAVYFVEDSPAESEARVMLSFYSAWPIPWLSWWATRAFDEHWAIKKVFSDKRPWYSSVVSWPPPAMFMFPDESLPTYGHETIGIDWKKPHTRIVQDFKAWLKEMRPSRPVGDLAEDGRGETSAKDKLRWLGCYRLRKAGHKLQECAEILDYKDEATVSKVLKKATSLIKFHREKLSA